MDRFIIGIGGGSGSGKTTVTKEIVEIVGRDKVTVLLQDNYYLDRSHLSPQERELINFDHPDALDWPLLREHLSALAKGDTISVPEYDFATHTRKPRTLQVIPARIIILEGLFALFDEEILKTLSLRVFVDTAADIRLTRRLRRDTLERNRTMESVLTQYTQYVRPMYRKFVEPTKHLAQIIIPHGLNKPALEMMVSRINAVLDGSSVIVNEKCYIN